MGTNDRAQLTGNILEDEKILGTVHVAFGASAGIGGTVSVPIHLDAVILDASLEVDGQNVLDHGRYVLDERRFGWGWGGSYLFGGGGRAKSIPRFFLWAP